MKIRKRVGISFNQKPKSENEVRICLVHTIASLKFLVDGPHRRRNFAWRWHEPNSF